MTGIGGIFTGETDTPIDAPTGFVDEGQIGAAGKYLLLGVEGFDPAGTMSTYLRIGAAAANAGSTSQIGTPAPTGEDLAALVQAFVDDTRPRGTTGGSPDDPTVSPPQNVSGGADQAALEEESVKIHSKGGWREHTDGNRVSTTRGDKVEVIQGNYKLVVLGRQDPSRLADERWRRHALRNSTGFDMSGGLTDDAREDLAYPDMGATNDDGSPRVTLEYRWEQESDGHWFWTQTTTIGSESPGSEDYGNPSIVNRTWVNLLDEKLGSDAKRVKSVREATWALTSNSETHVDGMNRTVTVGEILNTFTNVEAEVDLNLVGFSMTSQAALALQTAQAAGVIGLIQAAGVIPTLLAGVVIDEHTGIHVDTHLGAHLDTTFGDHSDTHLAAHIDTHMGVHLDSHFGTHVEMQNGHFKIDGVEQRMYAAETMVSTDYALNFVKDHVHVISGLQLLQGKAHIFV